MASFVKFQGGRDLERVLLALSATEARKAGRKAVRGAGNQLQAKLRAVAPIDKGRLKRALRVRVDRGRYNKALISALIYVSASSSKFRPRKTLRQSTVKGKKGPARYTYQIGSRPDVYGIFQEFGAPAHGLPARPWFRPTWEREKDAVIEAIKQELGRSIMEAALGRLGS